VDTGLTITGEILNKILNALPLVSLSSTQQALLKLLFLIAFHGFFRLGKLVIKSTSSTACVLQRTDVHFESSNNKLVQVQPVLRNFKTIKVGTPAVITVKPVTNPQICPVLTLFNYLRNFLKAHVWSPCSIHRRPSCYVLICIKTTKSNSSVYWPKPSLIQGAQF
jgi:hypothetical protein